MSIFPNYAKAIKQWENIIPTLEDPWVEVDGSNFDRPRLHYYQSINELFATIEMTSDSTFIVKMHHNGYNTIHRELKSAITFVEDQYNR